MTESWQYPLLWAAVGILATYIFTRRFLRPSQTGDLSDISRPPLAYGSILGGNIYDFIHSENVGEMDKKWIQEYGPVFRIKASLGESDALYLADPQAIHYVLDTQVYGFHKKHIAKIFRLLTGKNLLAADGEEHARQRKILLPGFSQTMVKDLVPTFMQMSERVAAKWDDILLNQETTTVDVHSWISRLALDAIGQGVFSYDFGALNDTPSEFVEAYKNVFFNMFHKRSAVTLALGAVVFKLPFWLMKLVQSIALRGTANLKVFQDTSKKIASDIIQREVMASRGDAPEGKDIMSSLVRANMSTEAKYRLTEEEMLAQTMILTIAGHDTTAGSLVWVFYELARHPEAQARLREEIKSFKAAHGNRELVAADFDLFSFAAAVIKETLRLYPIGVHNLRKASSDDVIPLSKPIKTRSGKELSAIPVKKGQPVMLSFWGYNRLEELWGKDPHTWRPERFLELAAGERTKHSLGVYANLATFSSGVHSCIGWRFAILEMHSILITLVDRFEFLPPPDDVKVLRVAAAIVTPMVKGQEAKGPQLPLKIRSI
ncbi:hypothetical protein M422DRAFT_246996 [Sphaerobolus stellatus SS14]|nr:hypothetical protein M422DRAFT_246996 [Sphaerobolus stellatus SS14]